jgi:2-amino-4-hydroxy-6-hydroxymethyldihydropteridine diphosphokinase
VAQGDSELTLPHPRITERSFVLLPLLEIAPDFFLPEFGALKSYLPQVAHQRIEKLTCRNCASDEKAEYRPSAH